MKVKFYRDAIAICDDNDSEIVYWARKEWIDESDVVFAIANSIQLAFTNPKKLKNLTKIPYEKEN